MRIEEGTTEDWRKLAHFHYRSHKIAGPRRIFCLKRGEELCGVIVYAYPPPTCFGRRLVLPNMSMKELNEKLSVISRVVVHPKYRTIGLGSKLVKENTAFSWDALRGNASGNGEIQPLRRKSRNEENS
jgi:GNAT superfamily N-acetyltransferase